jgi:CRP-like cAMP-binding protein
MQNPVILGALKRDLGQTDLFLEWEDLLLELVASISYRRTCQRGEVIFDEQSENDELFIVVEGEVEIQVQIGDADRQTIATLRRGQNFGEIALLDQGRRTAAAIAMSPQTDLIVISRHKLMVMCENVPRLGYLLMRNLANDLAMKIRNTDIDMRAHLTWGQADQA